MKEFLELIIKNLVENKEEIAITEKEEKGIIIYTVKINPSDMGRVIGKEGKIANAIRTLMKSLASAERKKISVQFVD